MQTHNIPLRVFPQAINSKLVRKEPPSQSCMEAINLCFEEREKAKVRNPKAAGALPKEAAGKVIDPAEDSTSL